MPIKVTQELDLLLYVRNERSMGRLHRDILDPES